jgi:thiamine-monophosphate kinase
MTSSSSNRPGEFELIARLFAPLAQSAPGAFGLTDDAAVIAPPVGEELVVTADALVEGVHFLRNDPPDSIAKKSLRMNLSDLAAKGASPIAYLLALSLPDWTDMAWLEAFARGLGEDQRAFGVSLIGGDTTRTPGPLTLAITALGSIPTGTMIRRSGAKADDLVFVSGTIGDAGGGLAILKGEGVSISGTHRTTLIARYREPSPRVSLGLALRELASAALDVSDGLLADLGHIADTSKVRIAIDAARIPISPALRALWGNDQAVLVRAATSGDDYEIAFTAPEANRSAVMKAAADAKFAVSEIGRVVTGSGVTLLDSTGREIDVPRKGYVHF